MREAARNRTKNMPSVTSWTGRMRCERPAGHHRLNRPSSLRGGCPYGGGEPADVPVTQAWTFSQCAKCACVSTRARSAKTTMSAHADSSNTPGPPRPATTLPPHTAEHVNVATCGRRRTESASRGHRRHRRPHVGVGVEHLHGRLVDPVRAPSDEEPAARRGRRGTRPDCVHGRQTPPNRRPVGDLQRLDGCQGTWEGRDAT